MNPLILIELNMRLSNIERLVERIAIPDQWMDIDEAVQYSRCSVSSLRRGYQRGTLKYGKVKRKYLFKRSAIDRWLENG
ncbi:helix-turn-helix domain-containing protein [Candidatus Neomarinimicrobiota bacterium]